MIMLKNILAIRVEWLIACADLDRWREEEKLLREELRRIVAYCRWKAKDMEDRRSQTGITEGFACWMEKKRRMWEGMARRAEITRNNVESEIASGKW